MKFQYTVDDLQHTLEVEGEINWGADEVLFRQDDNLLDNVDWVEPGYTVVDLLGAEEQARYAEEITRHIASLIERFSGESVPEDFSLADYHRHVDDDVHYQVVGAIHPGIPFADLGLDQARLNQAVSDLLGIRVHAQDPLGELNPLNFDLRLIRPGRGDFNPPHRDVYLERLRHAVNLYIPMAGSTKRSSLPLFPGTHLLKESQIQRTDVNPKVNGLKFSVPCIVNTTEGLEGTRPNPSYSEVLVFTPYLVHGGGFNANDDQTRVSLEYRLWRA